MSRFALTLCVVLLEVLGGSSAEDAGYSVFPWPYGIVIMADEVTMAADEVVALLAETTAFVCAEWALPLPAVPPDWEQALDRNICRGIAPLYLSRRWIGELDVKWWGCPLPWGLRSINPLTVVIFPSVERLREVRGTWGARALFGTVVLHEDTPHHLTLHTGPAVSIAAPDLEANPGILAHELLHWFQQDSLELSDLPYILVEGFARLTSERLLGTRTYEPVAAAFARSGTLSDVPLSLIYDVGASVAGFLWERLGGLLYDYLGWGSGGCRGLSRHCESWDFVVDEFKEQWLERLATVELSDADWVHYRAASQRLGTVYAMLEPVLGAAAKARFEAIWSDSASLVDLIEFWRIVEVTPPEPTEERWEDLAKREQTFVHIGVRNACYAAPPPVYPIEFQGQDQPQPDALQPFVDDLVALRLDGDWPTYYGLFVQLVRDLIAGGAVYEEAIPWWPAAGKSP